MPESWAANSFKKLHESLGLCGIANDECDDKTAETKVNNHNVLEDTNYRNYFNFVGQKNSLKDNLSVKNNLKLWEIIYQKNISYSKLLEDFNMSHLVERDVASLSDGQKKCISLLRLNFTESKIWYLDEPFVFLDEENSQKLIQNIKNFNTNNGIVIITSNINLQNTFTNEIKI